MDGYATNQESTRSFQEFFCLTHFFFSSAVQFVIRVSGECNLPSRTLPIMKCCPSGNTSKRASKPYGLKCRCITSVEPLTWKESAAALTSVDLITPSDPT